MRSTLLFRFSAIILLTTGLAACDGGGGSAPAPSNGADRNSADPDTAADPPMTEAERKAKAQQAYETGLQLLDEKQPHDAARAFDEAIRLDGTHAQAFAERGKLQVEYGDLDRGGNDLYRAVELNGELEAAYLGLAVFHEKKFEQTGNQEEKQKAEENLRIVRRLRGEREAAPTQVNSALDSILQSTLERGQE